MAKKYRNNLANDGKNRSGKSPSQKSLSGKDILDLSKTLGEIDYQSPPEKFLAKLKRSARFFPSTATSSGEINLKTPAGFSAVYTRTALCSMIQ